MTTTPNRRSIARRYLITVACLVLAVIFVIVATRDGNAGLGVAALAVALFAGAYTAGGKP